MQMSHCSFSLISNLCQAYNKIRKEKSLEMKSNVGMACQKITQTRKGGYKSEGIVYKAPSLHLYSIVNRCRNGYGSVYFLIYLHFYILPSLFVIIILFGIPSFFSFTDFSFLVTFQSYGKAGNGNEMETGNGSWKQKWEANNAPVQSLF